MSKNGSEITGQAELSTRPRVIEGGKGLVVTRIAKSYNRRPVVRSVSLSVKRGEVVGLLGPNGAGKTTCFYMITGLIPADSGYDQARRRTTSRGFRCTGARASASATCRRKPRSSAV